MAFEPTFEGELGFYLFFFIFGAALLFVGLIMWLESSRIGKIKATGQQTQATVKKMVVRLGGRTADVTESTGKNVNQTPVFEYMVEDRMYEKLHNVAQHPPKYRLGQRVSIIYNPENPMEMVLANSGKIVKILMIIFGALGLLFLLIGFLLWI